VFADSSVKIVNIDNYHFNFTPTKYMLITMNKDIPGVVGKIGTVLGKNKVNIGGLVLGRHKIGQNEVSVILIDNHPSDSALKQLKQIKEVKDVKLVEL
jgi:D-3-phosphoglycerate dehydrogenase